jgi:hypothetical protein
MFVKVEVALFVLHVCARLKVVNNVRLVKHARQHGFAGVRLDNSKSDLHIRQAKNKSAHNHVSAWVGRQPNTKLVITYAIHKSIRRYS